MNLFLLLSILAHIPSRILAAAFHCQLRYWNIGLTAISIVGCAILWTSKACEYVR